MYLRLSDNPQVEGPAGAPLPLAARDAALLAWLAIEGPTPRDRLAALLWPESTETQARTTLRQRLFQLKRAVGYNVAVGSPLLALAPGVEHDLIDATELLGELGLPDAPDLDAWLQRQREQRRRREQDALRDQLEALEAAGEAHGALQVAQALLRLQPLSELAHQRVMRLHYLLGDRAAALAAFDACEQALKNELSARPSPNTLALLNTIEQATEAAPQRGFRALPAAVHRPPVMVGREHELRQLTQAWQRGQVAAVVGEAGQGKSRLLAEFMAGRPGTVRAAARPGDDGVPFATLARLLRVVGEHGALADADAATRQQLAPLLPELANDAAASLHPPRQVPLQAIIRWLRTAPGVTGLLIDDLHFADTASLDLLSALLLDHPQNLPHCALAYRGAEAPQALGALQACLADRARLARIEIEPLDACALAELVDQLGLGWSGAAVSAPLLQRTGGNPLFLLETLKQAWLEPTAGWPKPESVERLLDRRIARLAPAPLALARVAAIAHVDFSVELAAAVLGGTPLQQADALNELEAAEVLRGLQFSHDLVFDAVLRSLPQAVARHVHTQVAAWLEAHAGEPARIATHWRAAGQAERAPPWLGLAAQRAVRLLRNGEALAFLALKARCEADAGDQQGAFLSQVETVRMSLDMERDTDQALARCELLQQWATGPEQQLEAAFWRASLAFRTFETDASARLLAVTAQAEEAGVTHLAMECRVMLTLSEVRFNRCEQALKHANDCVDWIARHGNLMRRGELQCYLAALHNRVGTVDSALSHHRQAVAIARELGLAHHVATVLQHQCATLWLAGRSLEAIECVEEALAIDAQHETACVNTDGRWLEAARVSMALGRYGGASLALDHAEALTEGVHDGFTDQIVLQRGLFWADLGQWGRAQAVANVRRAKRGPNDPREWNWVCFDAVLGHMGQADTDREIARLRATLPADLIHPQACLLLEAAPRLPPAEALEQLQALIQRMGSRGYDGYVVTAHVRSAQIALPLNPVLAREHALQALALAATRDVVGAYRGELWLHAARALQAAGDHASATAVLAEGQAWVRATAAEQVPEPFRDSFLRRNPTNAALLGMSLTSYPVSTGS